MKTPTQERSEVLLRLTDQLRWTLIRLVKGSCNHPDGQVCGECEAHDIVDTRNLVNRLKECVDKL